MSEKSVNLELIRQMVIKDLTLSDEESAGLMTNDQSKLIHNLTLIVKYLLDHDFNRLINACYRLDVAQDKFQEALNFPDPEKVPEVVAQLIMNREQEKVKWRMKYS